MITQELVKELFEYKDGKFYRRIKNNSRHVVGEIAGSLHPKGYRYVSINKKTYAEHRLIWLYHYGQLPKIIDHINQVKDDNRIENLRQATNTQNQANKTKRKILSSVFKGVCWKKMNNKWEAQISGKYLGLFDSEIDAAIAYNNAAVELFGEYALTNKI